MIKPSIVALLLCATVTSLLSQDRAFIRFGPALGYREVSANVTAVVEPGIPSTRLVSGLLPNISASAGLFVPVSTSFYIGPSVEWSTTNGTTSSLFIFPVSINGEESSGQIRRYHDVGLTQLSADVGFGWMIGGRTFLTAAIGMTVPLSTNLVVSEELIQPAGATFVSTGTNTRELTDAAFTGGEPRLHGIVTLTASHSYALGSTWAIAPFLQVRTAITSALPNASWYPWQFGVGADVRFVVGGGPDADRGVSDADADLGPVMVSRVVSDTVNVVDAYQANRGDTTWLVRAPAVGDTVTLFGADTSVVVIYRTVERHLPSPPPFLSTVLDVEVDDEAIDKLAAMRMKVQCVSDTTTSTLVSVTFENKVVWQEEFRGETFERTVVLSTIVPALAEREVVELDVSATTTDAVGQRMDAVPRHIRLERTDERMLKH